MYFICLIRENLCTNQTQKLGQIDKGFRFTNMYHRTKYPKFGFRIKYSHP